MPSTRKQMALSAELERKAPAAHCLFCRGRPYDGTPLCLFLPFLKPLASHKKQKKVIEEQKQKVEEQKQVVEEQKQKVEEQKKDITDSIRYAENIQRALYCLPLKTLKTHCQMASSSIQAQRHCKRRLLLDAAP